MSEPQIEIDDVFPEPDVENESPAEEKQKHHLQVHLEPTGGPGSSIVVGGTDITDLTHGVDISARAGDGTQAIVLLRVGHTVDFDGLADVTLVQQFAEADPAEISAWISRIDAKSLEEAALQRLDLESGKPHGLTEAMLRQLTEWAAGVV